MEQRLASSVHLAPRRYITAAALNSFSALVRRVQNVSVQIGECCIPACRPHLLTVRVALVTACRVQTTTVARTNRLLKANIPLEFLSGPHQGHTQAAAAAGLPQPHPILLPPHRVATIR